MQPLVLVVSEQSLKRKLDEVHYYLDEVHGLSENFTSYTWLFRNTSTSTWRRLWLHYTEYFIRWLPFQSNSS